MKANKTLETIDLVKDGRILCVNSCDAQAWLSQGWKAKGQDPTPTPEVQADPVETPEAGLAEGAQEKRPRGRKKT